MQCARSTIASRLPPTSLLLKVRKDLTGALQQTMHFDRNGGGRRDAHHSQTLKAEHLKSLLLLDTLAPCEAISWVRAQLQRRNRQGVPWAFLTATINVSRRLRQSSHNRYGGNRKYASVCRRCWFQGHARGEIEQH